MIEKTIGKKIDNKKNYLAIMMTVSSILLIRSKKQ